jgi:hypothetical protein
MKKITLFTIVLLFGIVKPKAQQTIPVSENPIIKIISFECFVKDDRTWLEWTVDPNSVAERFEVEKSFNGKDFKTCGFVLASEEKDAQQYAFFETASKAKKTYYRLKMIDKGQQSVYSTTITADSKTEKAISR